MSAAPRSTWRRPTPTHSWRRPRRNADGGAPQTPFIPAPAFAGVNSRGNPRLRVPGERSETRDPETRARLWIPAFAGTNGESHIYEQSETLTAIKDISYATSDFGISNDIS